MTERVNRIKLLDLQADALIEHLESTTRVVLQGLEAIDQNSPQYFGDPIDTVKEQLQALHDLKERWRTRYGEDKTNPMN